MGLRWLDVASVREEKKRKEVSRKTGRRKVGGRDGATKKHKSNRTQRKREGCGPGKGRGSVIKQQQNTGTFSKSIHTFFLFFPPQLSHSLPSWYNARHVFGRMTTRDASFSLCSGTWGRVMKTIVALSSLVMITPFPQHWSLGRNVFKTEPFSSARLSSHCLCVVCVCL